jgi:hypothetical protein
LEDNAEITLCRRQRRDIAPRLDDAPHGRRIKPGNGAEQGGLATARWTKEGDQFARWNIQAYAFERNEIAELLANIPDDQEGIIDAGKLPGIGTQTMIKGCAHQLQRGADLPS